MYKSIKLLYEPCNVASIMHFPCSMPSKSCILALSPLSFTRFLCFPHLLTSLASVRICVLLFAFISHRNKCHFTVRLGGVQLIFHGEKTEANNFAIRFRLTLMEMSESGNASININTEVFVVQTLCLSPFCRSPLWLYDDVKASVSHENFTRFKSIVNIKAKKGTSLKKGGKRIEWSQS